MKFDKLHMVLMLACAGLAALSWRHVTATEAAKADAERYKRFAVWSLDHADAELAAQARRSAANERELERYLTDEAREQLRETGLLSSIPPLPQDPKMVKRFVGNVDTRTLEEIQRARLSAK